MTKESKEELIRYILFTYIIALIVIVVFVCNWTITCRARGCYNGRPSLKEKYCYSHRCTEKGCSEYRDSNNSFCKAHQEMYDARWKARQEAYAKLPSCEYPKCEEKVTRSEKIYCALHCCLADGCNNPNAGGSYCKEHQCSVSGCYKTAVNHSHDADNKKDIKIDRSNNGSVSKTKMKRKTSYPDCDDYDDYDDFMDDWDGHMHDGLDAEDYWEDW